MRRKIGIFTVMLIAGNFIILAAVTVWLIFKVGLNHQYESAQYYVERLVSVMPQRREGSPEVRPDNKAAAYEIDGLNFVGVLEMPDYAQELPVYGSWDTAKLPVFPCLFSGSAESGDMIIGSTADQGLFHFIMQLTVGDKIIYTDMTGAQFTYYITNIRHTESADTETLTKDICKFVLFIKDRAAMDYVIISADID